MVYIFMSVMLLGNSEDTFYEAFFPADIYLFKVKIGSTKAICEICSNDANEVVLVSLLLPLNIFHTLFYCFYC